MIEVRKRLTSCHARLEGPMKYVIIFFCSAFFSTAWAQKAKHPLDPLTPSEIELTTSILKKSGKLPEGVLFPYMYLQEPPKAEVLAYKSGPFTRQSFISLFDRAQSKTYEAIVDLNSKSLVSMTHIPGVQPAITVEELSLVPKIVRVNPEWQAAIKKRGITNFDDIMIDPWAPGMLNSNEKDSTRWVRALSYMKGKAQNGYARPIEGIVAVVNMNEQKVEYVMDTGVLPIPTEISDLNEKSVGKLRKAPKPLVVTQPQGPSFEINGNEVRWQKWRFRFSVHPRESLVLHTVGYEDGGRVRPVLYRAASSEMLVPYGDPAKNWAFRNAFDVGEYGIGKLTDSMAEGQDAPRHAKFFDFVTSDEAGAPSTIKRAVALFERDGGISWRHFEFYSNSRDSRRGRELVLSSIVTVANYDYGINWIFRQDGSLEMQAVLTGIMLAKGVPYAKVDSHHADPYSHLVAPFVAAPHHQHFFNFRIDLDVDGAENNLVAELNVKAMKKNSDNPYGNAIEMTETILKNEKEAKRNMSLELARKWAVLNSTNKNSLGHHTGYVLLPGDNSFPYLHPDSIIRKRAGFIDHHFWATPYDPNEKYAAGDYPNQSKGGDGLPQWTRQNRSIENKDVVVWYTFGVTHTPRPEEWPVMTIHTGGFKLLPVGFFSRNPAMDLPRN